MGSPFNQAYSGTVVAHLDACEALRAIATLPQDDETKIPPHHCRFCSYFMRLRSARMAQCSGRGQICGLSLSLLLCLNQDLMADG